MRLQFTKMHGIGNDFIVVDDVFAYRGTSPLNSRVAKALCDRRFGVGADQILWLRPPQDSKKADVRMEILNADGSIAEMCGNGIRAVALFYHQRVGSKKDAYRVETLAGVKTVQVHGEQVMVDMGAPGLGVGMVSKEGEWLDVEGTKLLFFEVSMGNPHAVFFVENLDAPAPGWTVETLGPKIENHPRFANRTNVEFVKVEDPSSIRIRVWERGAGITLACGTGACASAVAAVGTSRARGTVTVHLPGGDLKIRWLGGSEPVMMEGSAQEVFRGEIAI